jgi:hypothetical protein
MRSFLIVAWKLSRTALSSGERALWLLELALLFGIVVSVVQVHRRRISSRAAVLFAVLVGVVVATPFGIRADPISEREFRAAGGRIVDVDQSVSVAGLPLARMRIYSKTRARSLDGGGGRPSYYLRARSWIPPLLSVNASTIAPLCGSFGPCWTPIGRSKDDLQLRRGDDGARSRRDPARPITGAGRRAAVVLGLATVVLDRVAVGNPVLASPDRVPAPPPFRKAAPRPTQGRATGRKSRLKTRPRRARPGGRLSARPSAVARRNAMQEYQCGRRGSAIRTVVRGSDSAACAAIRCPRNRGKSTGHRNPVRAQAR